jgi:hypothetical protein
MRLTPESGGDGLAIVQSRFVALPMYSGMAVNKKPRQSAVRNSGIIVNGVAGSGQHPHAFDAVRSLGGCANPDGNGFMPDPKHVGRVPAGHRVIERLCAGTISVLVRPGCRDADPST